MEKLNIDDAVMRVLKQHNIEIEPAQELGFRTDLEYALQLVLKSYKFDHEKTVIEAKSEVFSLANFHKGTECPVCERHEQLRKYTINSAQSFLLMNLRRLHVNALNPKKYFHVENDIKVPLKVGGDWAKLRFWGLIEECKNAEADNKPRSGYWRLTANGSLFVQNRLSIPKYVTLYNAEFRGYKDEEDTITIQDVFDKKKAFSFTEVKLWSHEEWDRNITNL